ncbi:iron uptake transporter permease EfeU [Streptosporangium carneum]|uniref:Iron transporter n=1 Tax=Streptosporangium carneum TaxID=47481 RepID=A0A9W6I9U3_9ACTN|nr:iron uptake transporter permease EfeU [Streptosporangium carneum]GLK14717.1 iron transporter [Streptosporangium carneum]
MFASYLIGLREGLEATLVVSVLVAFLVKSDRKDRLPQVWTGVGAAVALSIGFGALLTFTAAHLEYRQQELFEAVVSLLATVFVTWMIFWMRKAARSLSGELRSKLTDAMQMGAVAVTVMAFLAVAREGLETALLFFASVQGATTSASPLVGISLGVLTAIVIGWGLYRSALRVNLTKFFTWTGLLLILVAAGILKYGVHDLQEAGVLPGLSNHAFDISSVLPADSWYGALLAGMFNITPQPSVLETAAWVAYAVPTLFLFLRPQRKRPAASPPVSVTDPRPAA